MNYILIAIAAFIYVLITFWAWRNLLRLDPQDQKMDLFTATLIPISILFPPMGFVIIGFAIAMKFANNEWSIPKWIVAALEKYVQFWQFIIVGRNR